MLSYLFFLFLILMSPLTSLGMCITPEGSCKTGGEGGGSSSGSSSSSGGSSSSSSNSKPGGGSHESSGSGGSGSSSDAEEQRKKDAAKKEEKRKAENRATYNENRGQYKEFNAKVRQRIIQRITQGAFFEKSFRQIEMTRPVFQEDKFKDDSLDTEDESHKHIAANHAYDLRYERRLDAYIKCKDYIERWLAIRAKVLSYYGTGDSAYYDTAMQKLDTSLPHYEREKKILEENCQAEPKESLDSARSYDARLEAELDKYYAAEKELKRKAESAASFNVNCEKYTQFNSKLRQRILDRISKGGFYETSLRQVDITGPAYQNTKINQNSLADEASSHHLIDAHHAYDARYERRLDAYIKCNDYIEDWHALRSKVWSYQSLSGNDEEYEIALQKLETSLSHYLKEKANLEQAFQNEHSSDPDSARGYDLRLEKEMDKFFAEKTLSKFRENYSQAHSTIDRLYEGEDRLRRLKIAEYAVDTMAVAEKDFAQEAYESAGQAAVLATTLLDLATSLTPGVGWARDAYEAISGKDLFTGEALDTFGRSMAVIGIIPFVGIAGKFNKALKVVKKLMKGEKTGEVVQKSEKILDNAKNAINIPYGSGKAVQEMSSEALKIRAKVDAGEPLYRVGTRLKSQTGNKAQFWSTENPLSPGYGQKYGIPPENLANMDFLEKATLKEGANYITRKAPAVGANSGGAIEVVVAEGSVIIQSHTSL